MKLNLKPKLRLNRRANTRDKLLKKAFYPINKKANVSNDQEIAQERNSHPKIEAGQIKLTTKY